MAATTFAVVYVVWPYQLFVSTGASELEDSGIKVLTKGREEELTASEEEELTELEFCPTSLEVFFTELEEFFSVREFKFSPESKESWTEDEEISPFTPPSVSIMFAGFSLHPNTPKLKIEKTPARTPNLCI